MYHLAIDWRRAKFFVGHRFIMPDFDMVVTPAIHSLFLSVEQIDDIIMIRNWLHSMAVHCKLFGRWVKSKFIGIVFVFDTVADLMLFRRQWEPRSPC